MDCIPELLGEMKLAPTRFRRSLRRDTPVQKREEFARIQIQGWLQDLLEEEMTALLGRQKSESWAAVGAEAGIAMDTGSRGGWR